MMSNIFEKIIAGEIPADIVHRDEEIVAFRDINPAAPVHILIVPVKRIPTVDDIADEDTALLGKMILAARDIARREGVDQDGYRLLFNCRGHGGQEVFHLHLHLLAGRPLGRMVAPE
jgi:histidine triad (HIT) family protein